MNSVRILKKISKGQRLILLTFVVFVVIIISAIYLRQIRILYDPTTETFGGATIPTKYLKSVGQIQNKGYVSKDLNAIPIPTKYYKYIGQVQDNGFISKESGINKDSILWTLPVCDDLVNLRTISTPRKYKLISGVINFRDLYFKPVKVWGSVTEVTEDWSRWSLCDPGPCHPIIYKYMTVDRVELDTQPLSDCETAYLDDWSNRHWND